MDSQFKVYLLEILNDLNKYGQKSKHELLKSYIADRLNKSVATYYKEINISMNYLRDKDAMNLARKLNKIGEDNDKI